MNESRNVCRTESSVRFAPQWWHFIIRRALGECAGRRGKTFSVFVRINSSEMRLNDHNYLLIATIKLLVLLYNIYLLAQGGTSGGLGCTLHAALCAECKETSSSGFLSRTSTRTTMRTISGRTHRIEAVASPSGD